MMYCSRKFKGPSSKNHKSIKTRNMKKFSEEALSRDVTPMDWKQGLESAGDANVLAQHFSNSFSQVIEKHAPVCQSRVSEINYPWINACTKSWLRFTS